MTNILVNTHTQGLPSEYFLHQPLCHPPNAALAKVILH